MSDNEQQPEDNEDPRQKRTPPERDGPRRQSEGDVAAVSQSIENMYRIIEPWVRHGENVASKWSDVYGSMRLPDGPDPQSRMMEAWANMAAAWSELLGTHWGRGQGGPQWAVRAPWRAEVRALVQQGYFIHVNADIVAGVETVKLKVPGFSGIQGLKVRLVRAEAPHEPVIVRVTVDDDVETGQFLSEVIIKSTQVVVGEVKVEILRVADI